ncbi:MAG: VOC family protein [Trueperaceae bacterium]
MVSIQIDHLLYAGPDLAQLGEGFTARSGLRAVQGGRHENWGTHNSLLGLGSNEYIELIASEPGASGPWGALFSRLMGPSLQAWCVRAGNADVVAAKLEGAGIATRRVPGGRRLPDGSMLTWELVFPRGHAFGGALPFFIDWQGSAHPALSLEPRATLAWVRVEHPQPDEYERVLATVGALPERLKVAAGPRLALRARFETASSAFELAGELDADAYLGEA